VVQLVVALRTNPGRMPTMLEPWELTFEQGMKALTDLAPFLAKEYDGITFRPITVEGDLIALEIVSYYGKIESEDLEGAVNWWVNHRS